MNFIVANAVKNSLPKPFKLHQEYKHIKLHMAKLFSFICYTIDDTFFSFRQINAGPLPSIFYY
jgi:hypothetical protein